MAFVEVPDVVMAEIRSEYLGQRVENTLYFYRPGGISTSDMDDLAVFLADWWTTGPRAYLGAQMFLREVYLTNLTTATSPTYSYTVTGDPGGPAVGEPTPGSVALCVSFRTSARGRSSRGRNYICGLTEAQVNGNFILQTVVDDIVDAYNTLVGGTGPDNLWFWVVVSRFSGGEPRAIGEFRQITNAVAVNNAVDSQRRRLAGRGQ